MKFTAFQLWWHTLRMSVVLQLSHSPGECLGTSKSPSWTISLLPMKIPHLASPSLPDVTNSQDSYKHF